MDEPAVDPSVLDDLFAGAPQIYVGVVSKGHPHVTPELFATDRGRLWILTAAVTHKVKVLADDTRVAFLASSEGGHVVGIGRASVLDAMKPSSFGDPMEVLRSAVGAARMVGRNAAELSGAALDALTGKLGGPLPPHRVVIEIEPTALAARDAGGTRSWGCWAPQPGAPAATSGATPDLDDAAAPENLRDLLEDGPAALGWLAGDGHPLVLPARWERETSSAQVATDVFTLCGASNESPAAVTRDKWSGLGPTGKQGVMLRGDGNTNTNDAHTRATVAVDRITYWDGIETHTAKTA